jgi:hypothetical protein
MSNLSKNQPKGMTRQTIRIWGLVFLAIGAASQAILQNKMLGVGTLSIDELNKLLESTDNFALASVAVVMLLVQACAIPVFSFLLVDGFQKTSNLKNYILRVLGVAALSEIPYNLVMSGKWLDLSSRNPVFAMVLGMVLLYLFRYYRGLSVKNVIIKILSAVLALIWADMLRIDDGMAIVIMIGALWALRGKRGLQIFGGCAVMFLCSALSQLYLLAPVMFLTVYFYNDEIGDDNRWINYLAYPAILLTIGLLGKYAF